MIGDGVDRRVEAGVHWLRSNDAATTITSYREMVEGVLAAADAVDDRDRAYRALVDLVATTDLRNAPERLKSEIGEIIREGESRSSGAVSQGEEDRT